MSSAPKRSPWGAVQAAESRGDGCWFVSTAGHGGMKVPPTLNRRIPARWRDLDGPGWYEEDCNWAVPVACLKLGPPALQTAALDTLKRWHPDLYKELAAAPTHPCAGCDRPLRPGAGPVCLSCRDDHEYLNRE